MVKDINPGPGSSNVREIIVANNKLFFAAYTEATGYERWISNGTANGTKLVKDITAGIAGSSPSSLINFDGKAYFMVDDIFPQLWKSDGTAAGTKWSAIFLP